jgi:hypothetical protein
MTKEDIVRMARESGFDVEITGFFNYKPEHIFTGVDADIQSFAALVAAAERKSCAQVCDDYAENQQAWSSGLDSPDEYREQAGHECADAIRAREQE